MSVIIRKVRTALHREYQKAGGVAVEEAIEQAQSNLGGLEEACLAKIDEALEQIAEMTADPLRRPSTAELHHMHARVNDMLGACAVIELPGLVDALYAVARLVGALITTEGWLDGALTPAVNLLRLVRRGAIPADHLQQLIDGIDQCGERITRHARLEEVGGSRLEISG